MSSIHDTAAFWFGRLHSPCCSEADRKNFTAWYNSGPAQAQAYDLVCSIWQASATVVPAPLKIPDAAAPKRLGRRTIFAGAVAMAVGAVMTVPVPAEATIRTTKTGQQMTLAVSPDVSILLDSDSSVAIYKEDLSIELLYGQIEVNARDQNACKIINQEQWSGSLSQGSFNLSKSPSKSTLTVFKGTATLSRSHITSPRRLNAGERATILPNSTLSIDRPSLEDVLAWRSGRLAFRNTPLSEVADEMNRYSSRKLRIIPPATNLCISGFYHFGQNETFARLLESFLPVHATFGSVITIMNVS